MILESYPNSSGVLVDYSTEMLKQAKNKLVDYKERIEIINSDIDDLNLKRKFDLVLNIYMLPFYPNSEILIKKLIS